MGELLKIDEPLRLKLSAGFPDEAYSQHPTKTFLTTLKAMYIVERLNDVFGVGRWTVKHEVELTTNDYVLIKGQLLLSDYDCEIPIQYGGHATTGKNTEIADGYKSAITDIISKSASYLEIGIDMFKGKISPNSSTPKNAQQLTIVEKTLTQSEVDKKWNGKIYKGNSVYIDNVLYTIPKEQAEKLKLLPKYKAK